MPDEPIIRRDPEDFLRRIEERYGADAAARLRKHVEQGDFFDANHPLDEALSLAWEDDFKTLDRLYELGWSPDD
jgi:hypothetical protein